MSKRHMEIGNFVCRFGDNRAILDLFAEIVYPAFRRPRNIDPRKKANCFILDPCIAEIHSGDINSLALTGIFVKDSKLEREEIVDETTGNLVEQPGIMSSASSAIFVLLLESHRLLYVKRQSYAPEMTHFASFLRSQFKLSHIDYITGLYEIKYGKSPIIPTSELVKLYIEEVPSPKLEIVPIASTGSLTDQIQRYSIIKSLTIELAPTNNELDNEGLFTGLRHGSQQTGSKKSTAKFEGDKEKGLDKDGCARQVEPATKQGKAIVTFTGKSATGAELTITNEECKMKVPVDESIAKQPQERAASQLYNTFQALVHEKQITLGESQIDKLSILIQIKKDFAR